MAASSAISVTSKTSNFPISNLLKKSPIPQSTNIKFTSNFKSKTLNSQFLPTQTLNPNRKSTISNLFTGIVEDLGEIRTIGPTTAAADNFDVKIRSKVVVDDVGLGDSISVNGICLTVTSFDTVLSDFTVGIAPETLRKTSLNELKSGSVVNLERALKPHTRMGGHFVQGHVDGTGEIVSMEREVDSIWVKVRTTPEVLKYIVPKGFIAVDGTSLTVVDVFDEECCFNFMMVAYTQEKIVISGKEVGMKVNLEVDILGKYVERILSTGFLDKIKASS